MKSRLVVALLAFWAAVPAQELIRNQEQLEEKVTLYWTAFVERDYMAAYAMYPADARSEISFFEWFRILGLDENRSNDAGPRLAALEILSITRVDQANFEPMWEVHIWLRLESQDGEPEYGVVSNVWVTDDDGNWAPLMPLALE